MSDQGRQGIAADANNALVRWSVLGVGAVVALALAVIAFDLRSPRPFRPAGGVGSMQAVTLLNGQVYFGTLVEADGSHILLDDVFEGVTNVNAQTNQRTTQLVRRKTAAWHAPASMAIPTDRILFSEVIGADSVVGKTLQQPGSAK